MVRPDLAPSDRIYDLRLVAWLLAGGIFYTSGVVFFVLDHWYLWCHGIWHLFVIAGSVSHYFSILLLY